MSKYTTGELAKLCNVSVRTVQYYDARGIPVPTALSGYLLIVMAFAYVGGLSYSLCILGPGSPVPGTWQDAQEPWAV